MPAPSSQTPPARPGSRTARSASAPRGDAPVLASWWLLAGALLAVLTLALGLVFTGAAASRQLADPGAVVRWGLPMAKMGNNIAQAITIAALVFATFVLPRTLRPMRRSEFKAQKSEPAEHPAFTRALLVAGIAGAAWAIFAIAALVFTYANVSGQSVSGDAQYTQALVFFMTDFPNGQGLLTVVIVAAIVATLAFGVRNTTALVFTLFIALIGLVPPALNGHAASSSDHAGAVNSIGLHVLGASLWVGGIAVLALLSAPLATTSRDLTGVALKRFSKLAFFSFFLVSASGVVSASIRITSWHDLFYSSYGQLVLLKVGLALLLGGIGFMHRAWIIPRLGEGNGNLSVRRVLWQIIGVELLVMAATSAVAVALASSAPPTETKYAEDASPAFILSGYNLPPELTPDRWLSEWSFDWLWVAVALAAAAGYTSGLVKLIKRGDKWPVLRALSWYLGLIVLVYVVSGAPAVYGRVLFSIHMIEHMALAMVVPIFLVLGSPVTLALRALTPRQDGSRGIREWLLIFVHSRYSQLITHPLFAAANFAGSIIIFYYSDIFGFVMRDHVGHELMIFHFLVTGYIFTLTMIGEDPLPRRAPYPLRLVLLLATMAFHAFFGVSIMGGTGLLAADYFGNLGRTWGESAIIDQQHGGAIAWGIGEVPTVLIAIGVAIMWSRSDERETKRKDRAADRNNDADLTAYNDMFARLADRDVRAGARTPTSAAAPERTTAEASPSSADPASSSAPQKKESQ